MRWDPVLSNYGIRHRPHIYPRPLDARRRRSSRWRQKALGASRRGLRAVLPGVLS